MICSGCGREAHDWYGDAWCDFCGGVMARPGMLIFRHVATVDGPGGRLPIVFDAAADDYKFRFPNKDQKDVKAKRQIDHFDFRPGRKNFYTRHGSLDGMIAVASSVVRGDGQVELSAAPTSTQEERALLGV